MIKGVGWIVLDPMTQDDDPSARVKVEVAG